MATFYGANMTKVVAGGGGDNYLDQGDALGRVRRFVDTYTAATTASGSVLQVGKLPAGAKVLEVLVDHAALGTGVTIKIGDTETDDRYLAASAAATAGRLTGTITTDYAIGTATADDVIILTTGGDTATGAIKVTTLFVVD